jgi:hypothetical protein
MRWVTTLNKLSPQAIQDMLDELAASRASRKRAWENLQEIRWVIKDVYGIELLHAALRNGAVVPVLLITSTAPISSELVGRSSDAARHPIRCGKSHVRKRSFAH